MGRGGPHEFAVKSDNAATDHLVQTLRHMSIWYIYIYIYTCMAYAVPHPSYRDRINQPGRMRAETW